MTMRPGLRLAAITTLILLAGCHGRDGVTVVKLGHGLDPAHPVHRAMEHMQQRVAELSDGHMRIDLYPSQQLGSERELLELLQLGSLGMTKVTAAVLEGFVAPEKAKTVCGKEKKFSSMLYCWPHAKF